MSAAKEPTTRAGASSVEEYRQHDPAVVPEPMTAQQLRHLTDEVKAISELILQEPSLAAKAKESSTSDLLVRFNGILADLQKVTGAMTPSPAHSRSFITIANNMERSIEALGPALAELETPVSPQLARSIAATESAWRRLEAEFGLLSSLEVSELVGSKSPNRSYASEQRSKGRLIAVKRPGGLRYPGFQFDRDEHTIRPVMADLIQLADAAGRSEASLALWMTLRTGYLDGDRPVDQLSNPDKVAEAARQSFNVQW